MMNFVFDAFMCNIEQAGLRHQQLAGWPATAQRLHPGCMSLTANTRLRHVCSYRIIHIINTSLKAP